MQILAVAAFYRPCRCVVGRRLKRRVTQIGFELTAALAYKVVAPYFVEVGAFTVGDKPMRFRDIAPTIVVTCGLVGAIWSSLAFIAFPEASAHGFQLGHPRTAWTDNATENKWLACVRNSFQGCLFAAPSTIDHCSLSSGHRPLPTTSWAVSCGAKIRNCFGFIRGMRRQIMRVIVPRSRQAELFLLAATQTRIQRSTCSWTLLSLRASTVAFSPEVP